MENKIHEISVLPTVFSDHSCVLLKLLASSTCTRGRGYWKLNKSLLSEACYRRKVTAFWLHWQYQKPLFLSLLEWWDTGKAHIKSLSIRYGIQRLWKRNKTKTRLEQSLQKAQCAFQNGQITAVSRAEFFRKRLQEYEQEYIQGKQVRCRAKWIESGETSGSFSPQKKTLKELETVSLN